MIIADRLFLCSAIALTLCAIFAGCESSTGITEYNRPRGSSGRAFDCEVPNGWNLAAADAFSKIAFEVHDGDDTARITVSSLAAGGGQRLPNVNRWRRQMGLEPTTEDRLADELTSIAVGGHTGHYMKFDGPDKSLQGSMVKRGAQMWFFKLSGNHDLVQRETERFRVFLDSFEFFDADGV